MTSLNLLELKVKISNLEDEIEKLQTNNRLLRKRIKEMTYK